MTSARSWGVAGVALAAVLLFWVLLPEPEPVEFLAPSPAVARWVSETPHSHEAARSEPDDPVLRDQVAWTEQVKALGLSCELPLRTTCEGSTCAAMTEVPLLNHPMGWVRMAQQSPSLVASVIAGDLGLPDRVLPCRGAIRDMGMRTVARPHGAGERWCLVQGDDPEGLCDRLSGEVGFVEGADRIVELRPPGT